MPKYQNKYRIASARRPGWDYRRAGAYFITICTRDRVSHFGECRNGQMKLSTIGLIVQGCWYDIPRWNPSVELGAFIIMPDHLHGILILDGASIDAEGDKDKEEEDKADAEDKEDRDVQTLHCNVSTTTTTIIDSDSTMDTEAKNEFFQKISPKSGSVSVLIRSFKSAASRHIRRAFPEAHFAWQKRFHDHIIRNEAAFDRITQYIQNNPAQWKDKGHG
jgi:REP element-mobilizing transposase RayT